MNRPDRNLPDTVLHTRTGPVDLEGVYRGCHGLCYEKGGDALELRNLGKGKECPVMHGRGNHLMLWPAQRALDGSVEGFQCIAFAMIALKRQ